MLSLSEKSKSFLLKLSPKRLASGFVNLRLRDKLIFFALLIAGLAGSVSSLSRFYLDRTILVPEVGGIYTEGVVGHPRYINPAIPDQQEAEEILETLIFSGLYKADGQGGVMPDLAESLTIFEEGKVFLVSLRDDIFWHDGEKITARDVVFTLELLKNQELQNAIADFWRGIDVEILSDKSLKFTLKKSYRFFPAYLTFRLVPEHLWKDVQASSFIFSEHNLKPIGSGPYKFKKIVQDKDGRVIWYGLVAFDKYYEKGPYLESFNLEFFSDEQSALNALRKKEINGLARDSLRGSAEDVRNLDETQVFSMLFNNSNEILTNFKIRQAISLAIDKESILLESFHGAGILTDSAVPLKEFSDKFENSFNQERSREILAKDGWQDKDEDGFLEKRLSTKTKTITKLEFSLLFRDLPEIVAAAERIKSDLASIGIGMVLKPMGVNEFSSRLQTRSYQLVLLGLSSPTGKEPDLFPFWHSSQKISPGLNFAVYENKEADKILALLRSSESENLDDLYSDFDAILANDIPGVFLFQPQTYWLVDASYHLPEINLISGSGSRFSRANEWHLYLKRVWQY